MEVAGRESCLKVLFQLLQEGINQTKSAGSPILIPPAIFLFRRYAAPSSYDPSSIHLMLIAKSFLDKSIERKTHGASEHFARLMNNQENIRNVFLIGEAECGKHLLLSTIAHRQDRTEQPQRYERMESIPRGVTIHSAGITLAYRSQANNQPQEYLLNLLCSSDSTNPHYEIATKLRISDGALLVVDAYDGMGLQTEALITHAQRQKIPVVLLLNKMDRLLIEPNLEGQALYQRLVGLIEEINILQNTASNLQYSIPFNPTASTVAFGSAKQGWAFTIDTFAAIYSKKFKVQQSKLKERLWGDHYYCRQSKTWISTKSETSHLKRGFVQYILDPINKLRTAILNQKKEQIDQMMATLGVKLFQGECTFPKIMSSWLGCLDSMLEMVVLHVPSPRASQLRRVEHLYDGPLGDDCAIGIRNCDPKGPLMIYISQTLRTNHKQTLYSFGRVFSGTASEGVKIIVMGVKHDNEADRNIESRLGRLVVGVDPGFAFAQEVPCGNLIAITDIDKYLLNQATLSNCQQARPIRTSYTLTPLMKTFIPMTNPAALPELLSAAQNLCKLDPTIKFGVQYTGQNCLYGLGEQQLRASMEAIRALLPNEKISAQDIIPIYKETITAKSDVNLAKSPNKHNRLFGYAQPLAQQLVDAIENSDINAGEDAKVLSQRLHEQFRWEKSEAQRIWSFGPDQSGPNLFVDMTKGVARALEHKDMMVSAWQAATKNGVLIQQNVRGMRLNLVDFMSHSDAIHRGTGQIFPTSRRLFYGCQLSAVPTLLRPVYACDVTSASEHVDEIVHVLRQRKAEIITPNKVALWRSEGSMIRIRAYVSAEQSLGLTQALPERCRIDYSFDHWEVLEDLPYDQGSEAEDLIKRIRTRKGLDPNLPDINQYKDRL